MFPIERLRYIGYSSPGKGAPFRLGALEFGHDTRKMSATGTSGQILFICALFIAAEYSRICRDNAPTPATPTSIDNDPTQGFPEYTVTTTQHKVSQNMPSQRSNTGHANIHRQRPNTRHPRICRDNDPTQGFPEYAMTTTQHQQRQHPSTAIQHKVFQNMP